MTHSHDNSPTPPVYEVDLTTGERVTEPPPDLDTPTMQSATLDASGQLTRVYVSKDGEINVDMFDEPVQAAAKTIAEIVRANVARLRKQHDWSQVVASKRLRKLSRGTQFKDPGVVQKIESGRRALMAEDLFWLCELFGVAIWELLLPSNQEHALLGRTILGRDGASELLFHLPGDAIDKEMQTLRATHDQRIERRRALLKELELEQVMALLDPPVMTLPPDSEEEK